MLNYTEDQDQWKSLIKTLINKIFMEGSLSFVYLNKDNKN